MINVGKQSTLNECQGLLLHIHLGSVSEGEFSENSQIVNPDMWGNSGLSVSDTNLSPQPVASCFGNLSL